MDNSANILWLTDSNFLGSFQSRNSRKLPEGFSLSRLVENAIKSGTCPNMRGRRGQTPLMGAAMLCDFETCRILLNAGANPNAQDEGGFSPLFYPLEMFSREWGWTFGFSPCMEKDDVFNMIMTVRLLLEAGSNPNIEATPSVGETLTVLGKYLSFPTYDPLEGEAIAGVVELLLEYEADVKALSFGEPPLVLAAKNEFGDSEFVLQICKSLIKAGADVNARNRYGETPLLANYGISGDRENYGRDPSDLGAFFVQEGADVKDSDLEGKTALMHAIEKSNYGAAVKLIRLGATE